MTNQYPINFDEVQKGSVFTTAALIDITGESPGTDAWTWTLRRLQDEIQKRRRFTVKNDGKELRVLTDPEASVHNDRLFRRNMRGMFGRHALNCAVESSALDEAARVKHDRTLITQSRYLGALTETQRTIKLETKETAPRRIAAADTKGTTNA